MRQPVTWQRGITAVAAEGPGRLALALWLATLALDAQACRCAPLSLAEAFRQADVVAEVEIRRVESAAAADPVRAPVEVVHDFKRAAGLRAVSTPADSAQCGLTLQPGRRYWIFGRLQPGNVAVRVDTCDGSRPVDRPFIDTPPAKARGALRALAAGLDCASHTAVEIGAQLRIDADWPADGGLAMAEHSPNGAYAYVLEQPRASQRPPRVARLIVDREHDTHLALSLRGVAAVDAQWVNEKLILVRVSWNHTLRSDMLLDVEAGELIAEETIDDACPGESV